jgi:AAA15 family ATPase/GTPase
MSSIKFIKEDKSMLLQFLVENFRSFQKETILNLAPVKSRIHPGHILESKSQGAKARALPLAVFYGANAAGKSNLIRAMDFARRLIIEGTRGEDAIGTIPFRLGDEKNGKPSRFEFVLKHEGVLYTYGFAVTSREVAEEWLFATFDSKEAKLFERLTVDGKAKIEFGGKLARLREERNRLGFVAEGTRPNQLFLTEANERNVEMLKPLMRWFRDHLMIIWPDALYSPLVLRAHQDRSFTEFLSAFLRIADTGIQSINLGSTDADRVFLTLPEEARKSLLESLDRNPDHSLAFGDKNSFFTLHREGDHSVKLLTLKMTHKTARGNEVAFDAVDESDGTHRMMHLAPALFDLRTADRVYVIDELDRSMHPLICRLFVQAFLRSIESGESQGQIILTTHETSLLDLDILRRDEIWFAEKDEECSSRLTSLAEFKVRKDLSIDKGYINGRFGAIPFLGDIQSLNRLLD